MKDEVGKGGMSGKSINIRMECFRLPSRLKEVYECLKICMQQVPT